MVRGCYIRFRDVWLLGKLKVAPPPKILPLDRQHSKFAQPGSFDMSDNIWIQDSAVMGSFTVTKFGKVVEGE